MYEKYNALQYGVGGGGGEYVPQLGFGWSNGVALVLLQQDVMTYSSTDNSSDSQGHTVLLIVLCTVLPVFTLGLLVYYWYYHHQGRDASDPSDGNDVRDSVKKLEEGHTEDDVIANPMATATEER